MKRILHSIVISLIFISLGTPLFAQQPLTTDLQQEQAVPTTTIDTTNLFDVDIAVGTQSPWTKEVPLIIRFMSNITSDNVEVSWDAPSGVEIKRRHSQFVSVKQGEVYTYTANVKPKTSGTFNIAGNVTLWQYNTNYTSSNNTTITFGENSLTQPLTAGYTGAVILQYLIIAILVAIAGVGLYLGSKFGIKYLKEWLKPPE